ncbi:alpha-L-arabinofuranosidase C-terminal domain-containing protein [Mucilaginibacter sp. cycad4]|uniref:alpha-L-arabinofuranosidase C-terminal domain-containing protein n=1 Tax=Mucilaginibacter sp. cycad4 TaxID=3342096 RepID=UPI002AAB3979|nr:alpha-L-arabinofuranosidase C-terminal domain-containing protein [Mucilaginibacter gossypii]WPU97930.1 alpha-L-arabinofuranosidase C-terminal domain-containing protein [Mucilaginibacter gossypii]
MLKRAFLMLCAAGTFTAAHAQYTIATDKVKAHIQPTMYGIFFEDINLAADGGVYAELVKNRSFEFNMPLMAWKEQKKDGGDGRTEVINRAVERPENAHFIKSYITTDAGFYGFSNEGFRGGMGVKEGEEYSFSVIAKQEGDANVKLNIELHGDNDAIIGKAELTPTDKEWNRYSVKFKSDATTQKAQLYVWMSGKGVIDLDMISLFPEHTWKNRPGGLRADLVQKLADLKPGFLRFPGGCIVEGRDLNNRYQWKKTIGAVDKRENIINRWNTEFKHRPAPDYYQTFGLGFMEYFMTAEDIGASPLPILNCGMACEFNTSELVPLDKLDPYVQDALDLIEFANGDASTKWGKLRTDLGHPAPFNLKMIGVGNEQWGPQYVDRWKIFTKAIKSKYPNVKIVSALGPSPEGKEFDLLNKTFRSLGADILDEHYYAPPKWFRDNARRYDNYDRKGPKIFAGEYAAQSVATVSPQNKNNWECALSEAAFMTGLERNADVVNMASYAPLFAHVEGWQWTPNLIWFDNLKSYATPNYYVQQLFSLNKGTDVVPLTLNNEAVAGQNDSYATACLDKNTNELVIKFVNTSTSAQNVSFKITGSKGYQKQATITVLKGDNKDSENSLAAPTAVSPAQSTVDISGNTLKLAVEPYSFTVVRLKNK